MIPILFECDTENFSSYGIGTLKDTISCEVIEERNGEFECSLKYPVSAALYHEIQNQRIIKAKANETSNNQLFRIYRITTPIDGIITVYAQHISYDLSDVATLPFSSDNISASLALNKLFDNSVTNHSFNCNTDIDISNAFSVEMPKSVRSSLGDMISAFGGEFEWDNFDVQLHSNRGIDSAVTIEYGKNLTDMEISDDISSTYSDIFPYAIYEDEVIILDEQVIEIPNTNSKTPRTYIKDFTEDFDDETVITKELLKAQCGIYLQTNPLGIATKSITISFEPLWQQKQYSALLERVCLCDIVTVRHVNFGVDVKSKVIKTVYDTLSEKYTSITLGEATNNLIDDINSTKDSVTEVNKEVAKLPTFISSAIEKYSSLITGQSGGYVVLNGDENAQPYEILILDKPSIDSAVNVWRWNSGGLGFSNNGYNGPYETAMTADGQIVADFIASGTLYANLIKAGVISSVDGSSYWDLESGEVNFSAYAKKDSLDNKSTIFTEVPSAYIVNDTLILSKTIAGLETQLKKGTMYISSANSSDNDNFTLCDSDNNKLLDSLSDSLFTYNVRFEDWYKSDDYITSEESNASLEIISNQILHEVSQKYTSNEDVVNLEKSILTQTSNSFDFRFNSLSEDISDVSGEVQSNQTMLEEYIRFEGATIKLGRSDSDWTIEIHNDRIEFKELGNVIAYMTGQKLHITEANFTDSVSIQGLNFTQEANGSFTINPE